MYMDIMLSSQTRSALFAVQNTVSKQERTQQRLQSGKAVNSAVDDAVKYFKSKALSDRAQDFSKIKDGMDQTISLLKTTSVGLSGVERIYKQMKGLLQSAKISDANGIQEIAKQWDNLLDQTNSMALDSSYQGKSLVQPGDPTKQSDIGPVTQQVSYDDPTKTETIKTGLLPPSHDTYWYASGFNKNDNFHIDQADLDTNVTNFHTENPDGSQNGGPDWVRDPSNTPSTSFPSQGWWAIEYDSNSNQYQVLQKWPVGGAAQTDVGMMFTNVTILDHKDSTVFEPVPPIMPPPAAPIMLPDTTQVVDALVIQATVSGSSQIPDGTYEFTLRGDKETQPKTISQQTRPELDYSSAFNSFADPASIGNAETACNNSISYVQSLQAYYGGKNTAILNRIDFGSNMIKTMEEGSDKMTLADLNEEGANLVALQTRQQIGIQSISIAGQSQANIITLLNK